LTPDGDLARLVAADSRPRLVGRLLGRALRVPGIGVWLGRVARSPTRVRFLSVRVGRVHAWLLRHAGGRLRRSWLFAGGQPVLALITTGRRSGVARTTPVACFTAGADLVVAGMNLGARRPPAWALNLQTNPDAAIEFAGQRIDVTARRAQGAEAARLWQRWVELQSSAEPLSELAGREIPLFVLSRRSALED
jgi:F420H(2)-dependent quinone reductase